ncbi:MAG: signal recognition particle-docking protein FtsY [Candidatus Tectomicrobia bacterium]|nr:signal recognition particle-docking protein FtsY [Candidatus Tectomicrobia bacterium]
MSEERPKRGLLQLFRRGLAKTRQGLLGPLIRMTLGGRRVDADLLESLEEVLIGADLGVSLTTRLIRRMEEAQRAGELHGAGEVRAYLEGTLRALLLERQGGPPAAETPAPKPRVVLVVGVNGTGKTTSIGKLAHRFRAEGERVLLAAADTFRAAAVEQLDVWRERAGADIVKGAAGADPSAVVFDAAQAALARGCDVLIADTAGRLHTRRNLMDELKKIRRAAGRVIEGAPHEVLLVLDATTGQNALQQARMFLEGVGVTGVILTKLDGTAKGGIVLSIADELGIPIRYVGLGEGIEDLQPFDPDIFVRAILGE